MSDCIFCKIANQEIPADLLYQDEHIVAFADIAPKAEKHLLVIPRRHIENLNDLTADDEALMGHLMLRLPEIAAAQKLTGFRTITNTGKEGGQEVFHMHFHILGGSELPGF